MASAFQIVRLIILIRHAMKIWIGVEIKTVVMGSSKIRTRDDRDMWYKSLPAASTGKEYSVNKS
jgi:hypothetical protein